MGTAEGVGRGGAARGAGGAGGARGAGEARARPRRTPAQEGQARAQRERLHAGQAEAAGEKRPVNANASTSVQFTSQNTCNLYKCDKLNLNFRLNLRN